ncbi:hypothetical protein HU200_063675 [Digitaria exilis]|uniref:Uncharacterized protein n=1 Tax=Digitaria exilis TaxID=1010633 RepID=A0A835A4K9_9POAL|nr:hypothetical protein HU200_063675 [Digitaria exilis]
MLCRNNKVPPKRPLEIALGECPPSSGGGEGGDRRGADVADSGGETGSSSSSPVPFSAVTTTGLPPPDLLAQSSLRVSSPRSGPIRRVVRRGPRKIQ